jgi:hypothetical protein
MSFPAPAFESLGPSEHLEGRSLPAGTARASPHDRWTRAAPEFVAFGATIRKEKAKVNMVEM